MNVKFFPSALEELMEAADSYEHEVRGLGHSFLLEVERVAALIGEFPFIGERPDLTHRRVPLRRFPYALIFRHDGGTISVVAVAHRRRRPRYWAGRVHDRSMTSAEVSW